MASRARFLILVCHLTTFSLKILMIQKDPKKALFYGFATIIMWSTVATAIKLSLASLTPFQVIALGFSVASAILFVITAFTGEIKQIMILEKSEIKVIIAQGFLLFFYYIFGFYGYSGLPAQIASPINNSWPFALVFLNLMLYKEKVGKIELFGMFIAYSGVALVAFGGSSSEALGNNIQLINLAQMVIGTFFVALFWLMKNRSNLNHNISLFLTFLLAAILGFIASIIEGNSLADVTSSSILAAIALGFFEWGIPFVTWALALKLTNSVAGIGILSFFTPFLALFWISIFLGEPILLTTIIGLLLCIAGTFIQQKFKIINNDI